MNCGVKETIRKVYFKRLVPCSLLLAILSVSIVSLLLVNWCLKVLNTFQNRADCEQIRLELDEKKKKK